jgi:RNA recognition motif-containing protein
LKRCGIHWDIIGTSKGTADVEFFNPLDAQNGLKELDGILFIIFSD